MHDLRVTDLVDPGWRPALPAVIPFMGSRLIVGQPFVITLRALWLTFFSAVILIAVVATVLVSSDEPTGSVPVALAAIAVAACVEVGGIVWARRRRAAIDPASNSAGAYRTRLFAQVAFSEVPALVAFLFALIGGRAWIFYVGGAFALIGFAVAAPTRRDIAAQGPTVRYAFLTSPKA